MFNPIDVQAFSNTSTGVSSTNSYGACGNWNFFTTTSEGRHK